MKLVSLPLILYDFWRKIFFTSCSLNWANFIAWFPLHLEILGNINMCIIIICCLVCGVLNFETNLNLLNKSFFYITKQSIQKRKELLTWNKKAFFIIFKEFLVVRNFLRPESGPLNEKNPHMLIFILQYFLILRYFWLLILR